MTLIRKLLAATALAALVLPVQPALAQGSGTGKAVVAPTTAANPQQVYAAFTLNLTHFITWPDAAFASKTAPFVIGTFPKDPINEVLDQLVKGENVDGHPIQTLRIAKLDDMLKCHVVYLAKANATKPAVLARLAHRPILAVSEADGFLELGGHVRFVAQPPPTPTRLRVSVENLKSSGLESGSQLLRLAMTP